jgi:hypothetical protein
MNRKLLLALIAGAAGVAGYAFAQTVPVPNVTNIGQNDLVQIIPGGQPTSGNVYAAAGRVGGQYEYSYQVPVTAFTITPANGINFLYLNPAGTLATGTLNMPATPGDGQRFCIEDSQTQTAITVAANTGQTLASYGGAAVTALTANTVYCWFYIQNQAVWVRTQ